MTMRREFEKLILAIEKPLRFASQNEFVNLDRVKNLDSLASELVLRAEVLGLTPEELSALTSLRSVVSGFASLSKGEKRNRVRRALSILDALRDSSSRPHLVKSEKSSPPSSAGAFTADSAPDDPALLPLRYIKGVGPRIAGLFAKKGVNTVEDALFYFPRRYEDRREIKRISQLEAGKNQSTSGRIILAGPVDKRSRRIYQVVISDGSGNLSLIWFQFNEAYMRSTYVRGLNVIVSGEVSFDSYSRSLQIIHPRPENIEIFSDGDPGEEDLDFRRIVPIYPLTGNLSQRRIRKIMDEITSSYAPSLGDPIPEDTKRSCGLIPLGEAVRRAHFPSDEDRPIDLADGLAVWGSPPHRTLAFFDFFLMELALAIKKREIAEMRGISFKPKGELIRKFISGLPFELTRAQKRVILEIEKDMAEPKPMNRLLQGDVGCGKTIVAVMAMLAAVECGYQCTLMAPTEILADQHYSSIVGYVSGLGVRTVLLKGGISGKKKGEIYDAIASGEADIVVGTHALIEDRVDFKRLGLVVIDEQHRFGVIQRARIIGKGVCPDVLVLTATPIPRTLAMTVFGDLDVSVIDEMPPGRKPVKTRVFYAIEGGRERVYEIVRGELDKGRQGYFVCPLIEESESPELRALGDASRMVRELEQNVFPSHRIALLHGRMKPNEKERVMERFAGGDIDILVSTTVIEVGVDVPNATFMVVENAERFGLSQLHQLRGRIGRNKHDSYFLLITGLNRTQASQMRLDVISRTTDGFKIAEADLQIRGPGEFIGTRQSGIPEFRFANLLRDYRILPQARNEAFRLVEEDPKLKGNRELRAQVYRVWGEKLSLAGV